MSLKPILSGLKTRFYRRPKDELSRLGRWGPVAYFRMATWQREMEISAQDLPILDFSDDANPVELWFLTGKKFWYQTAFCAWTFSHQAKRGISLNIIDDGTLTAAQEAELRRLFSSGKTIRATDIKTKLESELPVSDFPILRQRWSDYINIRKLTDVHLGSSGRKLVLDSDMLFFDRPSLILEWVDGATDEPLMMTDCEESYGYSRRLMEELCGVEIPPLLNVGVCGLDSDWVDWHELEYWSRSLFEREGTSYYLEQALVAMIAARRNAVVLPNVDYITYPTAEQSSQGSGVMQHYVADSKPGYFGKAWRRFLKQ